jgi:tungstate transport system ATP-binding protein
MSELLFRLQGLQKFYEGRCVLDVEALAVAQGELFALVGPSGAGKSTLLRLLNFLEKPDSGRVEFLGRAYDTQNQPDLEVRRQVTTVFQRPLLLDRTVVANAAYGLRLRGLARDRAHKLAQQALDRVGMLAFADQSARTLSGGERQRTALARALALEPQVLLLDEPTANLDPANIQRIEAALLDLQARQGTSIIMVTHNVFQARRLADRAALLLEGRLVEVADKEDFFERPNDSRTREFVRGEMIY